jgi:DnaA family protein
MTAMQLPLGIQLDDSATFANFIIAGNAALLHALTQQTEMSLYFWGGAASGKTHLLQALCHTATQAKLTAVYLPLAGDEKLEPAMLEGLEQLDLVCIDDVHAIAGQLPWEEALFDLYNRIRDQHKLIRLSASGSPNAIAFRLPDLVSRLTWGPVFQLHGLDDTQKLTALQLRAKQRGFDLPEEVARYLLKHYPRDMHSLFDLLNRLDAASLQAQRRLTIPFVKAWIG